MFSLYLNYAKLVEMYLMPGIRVSWGFCEDTKKKAPKNPKFCDFKVVFNLLQTKYLLDSLYVNM